MAITQFLKKLRHILEESLNPTSQEYTPGKRDYGELPKHLKQTLGSIPSVKVWSRKAHPCSVELKDGRQIDCVYIVSAENFASKHNIVWPEDIILSHEKSLKISDIKLVKESPNHLPQHIAEKIYTGGETSMGLFRFTFHFYDNTKQTYQVASTEIDFLQLPHRNNKDIIDVTLHKKITSIIDLESPSFYWALYGQGENNTKVWYGMGVKFSPQANVRLIKSKDIRKQF